MYYNLDYKEKKIPTLLAMFFLFLIMGSLTFVFRGRPQKTSIQAGEVSLKNFEITNCTPHSCTAIAQTANSMPMWIIYGEDPTRLTLTSSDVRDLAADKKGRINHYFEINNLAENKKYYCRFITDKGPAGGICEFTTSPSFTTLTSNLAPVIGKITAKNGSPVARAIVVMEVEGANKLSTLTGDRGEWVIPFYPLTKRQSFQLFQPGPETSVKIKIIDDFGQETKIISNFKNLSQLETKTIILGTDFNIKGETTDVLSASSYVDNKDITFDINIPKEDALVAGQKPLFKGTAQPGRRVKLIFAGRTYTTYSDREGIWSLSLGAKVSPGKYILYAVLNGLQENEIKITRNFNILKDGESVLGEATSEAKITPSITPTVTPQISTAATASATIAPTSQTLSPTPATSITSTSTPVPTTPQTGSNILPLSLVSGTLIILGIGLIVIF